MSIEDLRENYKNSRQANDIQHKLNGATYRNSVYKASNKALIKKINHIGSRPADYQSLDDLNTKYGLNNTNEFYSLNKNKRWELKNIINDNMDQFNKDDLDVRLYETEFTYKRNKANLINIRRSKGEQINIKNTYANFKSIKQKELNDKMEKLNPKPKIQKINRFKNKNKNKMIEKQPQRIVINDIVNEYEIENDDNLEYEIEYEPNHRFNKFGTKFSHDTITHKKTFKRYESISDDETLRRQISLIENDEEIYSDFEAKNAIEISLKDLIENHSKVLIKKHENKTKKETFSTKNTNVNDLKGNKIYIERQISYRATQTNILVPKYCEPIKLSFEINKQSVSVDNLTELYGLKYSEAYECYPRRFNLNITDEVKQLLKRDNLDLIVWLRFQETNTLIDSIFFDISICTNLINSESISIDNINPCDLHNLEFIIKKSVELFNKLPEDNFKIKEKPIMVSNIDKLKVGNLPTIGGYQTETKNIDELKLELINTHKTLEVVKEDNCVNETNEFDKNCKQNKLECVLCFDERSVQAECTILKKCGHCVCNECMKYYVDSRLANSLANAGKFSCPSCSNELELALLINFASNANLLDIYLKLTVEKVLFVLNDYKWCPAANCSKILKVDLVTTPFGTVSCTCGNKICLRCNNAPHFPASCKNITNYYKELSKASPEIEEVKSQDNSYSGKGKRCPQCHTFMEKDYGCNQMHCTLCGTTFCWNCLRTWSEHLKLNDGAHACKEKESSNFIEIEFVGKQKRNFTKPDKKSFEDSLYHRKMRLSISVKQYSKLIQNLLQTINFEELLNNEESDNHKLSKSEFLIEKSKALNQKRKDVSNFLKDIVSYLNELHFICEHGYVLLRDKSLSSDTRNTISHLLKNLEVIIWRINYSLEYGSGMNAINGLKDLFDKGLKLIKLLNKIET